MNFQFESKADGAQQTPSHMMKTFFDTLSDSLQVRTKSSKETDSRDNPIRTRRLNPTRGRLPPSLQKWNYSPRIRERSSNSQKMKNYRSNRAFRSKKTSPIQKFVATIAKFSWPFFRMLQTEKLILQCGKIWTTTNSFLNRRRVKQQQLATKLLHLHQESHSLSTWTTTRR